RSSPDPLRRLDKRPGTPLQHGPPGRIYTPVDIAQGRLNGIAADGRGPDVGSGRSGNTVGDGHHQRPSSRMPGQRHVVLSGYAAEPVGITSHARRPDDHASSTP